MATGNIYISGVIGEDITDIDVIRQVKSLGEITDLNVYITSPGGSIDTGFSIYNYLKNIKVNVKTFARGNCDSIATVIFQAGDRRYVEENINSFVIHNAHVTLFDTLDANDLGKLEQQLRTEEDRITKFYQSQTGLPFQTLDKLMDRETNLKSVEVKELGFADQIYSEKKIAAMVLQKKINNMEEEIINGTTLSKMLNDLIDEKVTKEKSRASIIDDIAKAGGISDNTVLQILSGAIDCPPVERLEGFAIALGVSQKSIIDAALKDGCNYPEFEDKNKNMALKTIETKVLDLWNHLIGKTEPKNIFFLKLADGSEAYVDSPDGDFIGKRIVKVENGNITDEPVADGVHELAVGGSITVEAGNVASLESANVDSEGMDEPMTEPAEPIEEETENDNDKQNKENMNDEIKAFITELMSAMKEELLATIGAQKEELFEENKIASEKIDKDKVELVNQLRSVVTEFKMGGNQAADKKEDNDLLNVASTENLRALRAQVAERKQAKN